MIPEDGTVSVKPGCLLWSVSNMFISSAVDKEVMDRE